MKIDRFDAATKARAREMRNWQLQPRRFNKINRVLLPRCVHEGAGGGAAGVKVFEAALETYELSMRNVVYSGELSILRCNKVGGWGVYLQPVVYHSNACVLYLLLPFEFFFHGSVCTDHYRTT